jgi:hypothetical protein
MTVLHPKIAAARAAGGLAMSVALADERPCC